jgi:hypothetical protein
MQKINGSILSLLFLSFLMMSCGDTDTKNTATKSDSTASVNPANSAAMDEGGTMKNSLIRYWGAVNDTVKKELSTYKPIQELLELSEKVMKIKDSLREISQLKDADSLLFEPLENRAYKAMLDYQKLMETNPPLLKNNISLFQLTRKPEPDDSSFRLLPTPGKSTVLTKGDFYFLGAAPFISKLESEDKAAYKDAQGNPELRFYGNITENNDYLMNILAQSKNGAMKISYGPPVHWYDGVAGEMHGIGSLIHEFTDHIPVYFLTEEGLVPGRIVSVEIKIVAEYGCVSNFPEFVWGCSKIMKPNDILGIYIPLSSAPITSFKITRLPNNVWTGDLNNDGIPELACVSDTFTGINGDNMAQAIWFINMNGTWKILDWGIQPDCT